MALLAVLCIYSKIRSFIEEIGPGEVRHFFLSSLNISLILSSENSLLVLSDVTEVGLKESRQISFKA